MNSEIIWKLIDTYFEDNPYALVSHHQDSYNLFFQNWVASNIQGEETLFKS